MADFTIAHAKTAVNEGGYSNEPDDKGKETYRGISRVYHPYWTGWKIIDAFKRNSAIKRGDYIPDMELDQLVDQFYEKQYWNSNKLGLISNQDIANEVFDTGVNMGSTTAAKLLQEGMNLLNRNQKDYKDILVDGIIGRDTIIVVNAYPRPEVVVKVLNGLQFARYVAICQRDPSQENNFRGWLTRV